MQRSPKHQPHQDGTVTMPTTMVSSGHRPLEAELARAASHPASIRSSATLSVFEEVLLHASEPERIFFVVLNGELEKVSRFYDGTRGKGQDKCTQNTDAIDYRVWPAHVGAKYHGGKSRRSTVPWQLPA
ncbi:hypothetical protein BX666DRAFT_5854 [Dichotomocladium elegans]|nr:hypothetical protein BX666DRAFT_5854 [Dichotomocladium elegans]